MGLRPGEYVIVPGVGLSKVVAQHENRRFTFESPSGTLFRADSLELISSLWAEFEREVEQEFSRAGVAE